MSIFTTRCVVVSYRRHSHECFPARLLVATVQAAVAVYASQEPTAVPTGTKTLSEGCCTETKKGSEKNKRFVVYVLCIYYQKVASRSEPFFKAPKNTSLSTVNSLTRLNALRMRSSCIHVVYIQKPAELASLSWIEVNAPRLLMSI